MREIIYDLKKITDSRELLEAKPHKFVQIFIYMLIVILTTTIIWTYFGEMDMTVKANGVVRTNDKMSLVTNKIMGKVVEVKFKEGMHVKKGDVLYKIDDKSFLIEKNNIEKQLDKLKKENDNLNKFKESIIKNKNLFSKGEEYYNKFLKYKTDYERLRLEYKKTYLTVKEDERRRNLENKSICYQISYIEETIKNMNLLKEAINNSQNLLKGNEIYDSKYKDYEINLEKYKNAIEEKEITLELLKNQEATSLIDIQKQLYDIESSLFNANLDLQIYKDSYISNIISKINEISNLNIDYNGALPYTTNKINELKDKIDNLKLLEKSIIDNTNYFTDSSSEYYRQYQDYSYNYQKIQNQGNQLELDRYKNEYILSIKKSYQEALSLKQQLESNLLVSNLKLSSNNAEIYKLSLLEKSIQDDKNYFSIDDKEYYNKFLEYKANIEKYKNNIQQIENQKSYLQDKKVQMINEMQNKFKSAEISLTSIETDLSKYKNEYILNLLSQVEENKRNLQKLFIDLELNKTKTELNLVNIEYAKNTLDKYQIDSLVSVDDSIKNNLVQISELEKNLNIANINISDCKVVAQNDGIVNVIKDINVGDLLQSGVDILTVVPNSGSEYKVQLYVNNKDIGTLKEGNKVKFHFYALPYKEYGELIGKVSKISVDAKLDGQTGNSYYLVECDIENRPLYSHKGEKAEIKLGMTCEAYVVTKRKKILHYVLEKINLKD